MYNLTMPMVLLFSGCTVGITASLSLFFYSKNRLKKRLERHKKKQAMQAFLRRAQDQRCRFDVHLWEKNTESVLGLAQCTDVSDAGFILEFGKSRIIPSHVDARVHIYISMHRGGKTRFYDFSTKIRQIQKSRDNRICVAFELPRSVSHNQKRYFLRFSPKPGQLIHTMIWTAPSTASSAPPEETTSQQAASKTTEPHKPVEWKRLPASHMCVQDISSGGMLLEFRGGSPCPQQCDFLMCHFEFLEDSGKPPLVLFLVGQVIRIQSNVRTSPQGDVAQVDSQNAEDPALEAPPVMASLLGIQWQRWAQKKSNQDAIVWRAMMATDGVPPLSTWILRRHTMDAHNSLV